MTPLVSIVMPVYNAEATLPLCLDSVVAQTFRDFELICINDGSTDSSGEILERYAREHPWIRVVHQDNIGQYPTRNVGLGLIRGHYMMSIDCDDSVAPELVEKALIRAEATGADITIFGWDYLVSPYASPDVASWHLRGWTEPARARDFPLQFGYVWMKMYRRDFLEKHQLRFREDFYSKADVVFHWKSMSLASSITALPEALYHYRVHANSVTGTIGKRFIRVIDVMEAIKSDLRQLSDPKGLLPSWCPFALSFIYAAYRQLDESHQPEMVAEVRKFVSRLDESERDVIRRPGLLDQDTRYFYLAAESRSAEFRYGTLYRWKKSMRGWVGRVLLPAAVRRKAVGVLRRRSHTLSASIAKQRELRETVAELNEVLHQICAASHDCERSEARKKETGSS